jgi:hypothetical protein
MPRKINAPTFQKPLEWSYTGKGMTIGVSPHQQQRHPMQVLRWARHLLHGRASDLLLQEGLAAPGASEQNSLAM